MALLKEMKEEGIKPDEVTYNIFMDLLVKLGRLDEAKSLFSSEYLIDKFIQSPTVLDVHGLSHGAAFIALTIFIESYLKSETFILITGKGLHSNQDMFSMKRYLEEKIKNDFKHLKYQSQKNNAGSIVITIEKPQNQKILKKNINNEKT